MKEEKNKIVLMGKTFKIPSYDIQEIDLGELTEVKASKSFQMAEDLPTQLEMMGIVVAKANRLAKKAQTEYDIWKATKDKELRLKFENKNSIRRKVAKAKGDKKVEEIKVTESMLHNEIRSDPEYFIMKKKVYRAEENYAIMNATYWALQKKSEVVLEFLRQSQNQNKLTNQRIKGKGEE
jgi:hypothetical protein